MMPPLPGAVAAMPVSACRGLSSSHAWGLLAALGLWLGFDNDVAHLPPLALAWPVCLALLGRAAPSLAAALRRGWAWSALGGLAALYWLSLPVHDVGGLAWPPAVACAVFVTFCITAPGGAFACLAHAWRDRPRWVQALALALAWYLLEEGAARLLGFPWLALAGGLAAWPILVQAADAIGGYALAGAWTAAALLCVLSLPARDFGAWRRLAAGLALAALLLAYGGWRLHSQPFTAAPQAPGAFDVLFVEGNVDQNRKWLPAFQRETVDLYRTLTEQALADRPEARPLVIWPETALPFFFERSGLAASVRRLAARNGGRLLFGAPGVGAVPGESEPRVYNRAFLLGADGATVACYDKEHLVPFGEYLPEWLRWDFLEALLQGVGVYSKGMSTAPLRQDGLALGVLICYEGIFPWLAQQRVADGATVLVDISNDGWFGDSPAARQHLHLTALRAVEQNRWLLRGTNTGISAIIDARGRHALLGGQFRAQAIWGRALPESARSLYHHAAPWLPFAAIAALLALTLPTPAKGGNPQPPARHASTQ